MLAILNTSIITNFGNYQYTPLSLEEAQSMVAQNDLLSAIGHQSTADILTELLEVDINMNRINFAQEVGQSAIVFKLKGRAPEGVILSRDEIEEMGYGFGLLVRLEDSL